jgi:hypothetical protein
MSNRHPRPHDRWAERLRASRIVIPEPFDMDAFCTHLVQRRDRAIELVPAALGGDLTGLWVPLADADLVFFEQATTPLHQVHIQLHEIGHLLCDHPHAPGAETFRRLMPHLDLDRLERLLARAGYQEDAEREAEWFARAVGCGILRYRSPLPPDATPEEAAALTRAARTLGSPG